MKYKKTIYITIAIIIAIIIIYSIYNYNKNEIKKFNIETQNNPIVNMRFINNDHFIIEEVNKSISYFSLWNINESKKLFTYESNIKNELIRFIIDKNNSKLINILNNGTILIWNFYNKEVEKTINMDKTIINTTIGKFEGCNFQFIFSKDKILIIITNYQNNTSCLYIYPKNYDTFHVEYFNFYIHLGVLNKNENLLLFITNSKNQLKNKLLKYDFNIKEIKEAKIYDIKNNNEFLDIKEYLYKNNPIYIINIDKSIITIDNNLNFIRADDSLLKYIKYDKNIITKFQKSGNNYDIFLAKNGKKLSINLKNPFFCYKLKFIYNGTYLIKCRPPKLKYVDISPSGKRLLTLDETNFIPYKEIFTQLPSVPGSALSERYYTIRLWEIE
jgi:hypothetical protein